MNPLDIGSGGSENRQFICNDPFEVGIILLLFCMTS
jgi:hypothetical protein